MQKIIITGPESTGKTTLAKQLAERFDGIWIEEYARTYIQKINRLYEEKDLLLIAQEQLRQMEAKEKTNPEYLFCDTGLLVLKVWSLYKYKRCDPWIVEKLAQQKVTLYFLCGIDVPWEFDVQREHPQQRTELYQIYKAELQKLKTPFVELSGNATERLNVASAIITCLAKIPKDRH
ncbi:MAG TPA: ATPase [Saprospiraceae bacterium]|nr:ATPase [Saprospiraceae bacterium]